MGTGDDGGPSPLSNGGGDTRPRFTGRGGAGPRVSQLAGPLLPAGCARGGGWRQGRGAQGRDEAGARTLESSSLQPPII